MTVTTAAAGGEQQPKKYIQDERTGGMVLSPEYTIWKDAHHSKLSSMVWVTNNDDEAPEYFLDEEGSDVPPTVEEITTVLSTSVIGGKHAVPEGVAVEELKNFNGKNDLVNDCPPAVRELLTANTKKNGTAIFAICQCDGSVSWWFCRPRDPDGLVQTEKWRFWQQIQTLDRIHRRRYHEEHVRAPIRRGEFVRSGHQDVGEDLRVSER